MLTPHSLYAITVSTPPVSVTATTADATVTDVAAAASFQRILHEKQCKAIT
jgi:hypothetical protein